MRNPVSQNRWIKQRTVYSCTPVAFLNILKWNGCYITYKKDFKSWNRKTKTNFTGSHKSDYEPVLYKIPGIAITKRVPTVEIIDKALSEGKIILLRSMWKINGKVYRHLLLITNRTEKSFFLLNTYKGHAWFPKWLVEEFYLEKHGLVEYKQWNVLASPWIRR